MTARRATPFLEDAAANRETAEQARRAIAASRDTIERDKDTIAKARRLIADSLKRIRRKPIGPPW